MIAQFEASFALPTTPAMKVLLIEDELDTMANMVDILEMDGYETVTAASISQAVSKISESISVILLDRQLPDGRADEVLPELRRLAPQADVIVMTGYADLDSTIAAFRDGASDYLTKPINPATFRRSIQRIAERRQIEAELNHEQEFADVVLRTAEAVVLILDMDGRIVRFNPYFEKIAGWKLADVVGKDWFECCISPIHRKRIQKVFRQTIQQSVTSGIIHPVLTHDGSERQIRWSNKTLKGSGVHPDSIVAIGVDVTDLLTAQHQSLQSERLATIGRTITGLAHESRNALQRIQAGLEMLELELDRFPEARRDVESIQRATNDLTGLLEEVRSYAAPIHLHREHASLPEIWRRVWRNLELDRQDRSVDLVEQLLIEDCSVNLDVLRIEQVFRNLFENSMAACEDPAVITITIEDGATGHIQITVADNGEGLNEEQQEKIFDPFYTTRSAGTGLGMSIVQRIIEAHQGKIEIVARQDPGACFRLELPRNLKT